MTHEDEGHYAAKHPPGSTYDPALAGALRDAAQDGRVTCTAAHEIARRFKVPPSEVGKTADLLEYRIVRCQLGLYGYSPEKRLVTPAASVSQDLRARLDRMAEDGRISCASCWMIAEELGLEKLAVSSACELLGIKVKRCQLGAF